MLSVGALYLFLVIDIAGHIVPVIVMSLALRRARRSSGFNRWIYGYMALYAAGTLAFLATVGWDSLVLHLAALAFAWATLPLWLCLRVALLPTRSRPSARMLPPATAPEAEQALPIPFFTTWRMAARALQG